VTETNNFYLCPEVFYSQNITDVVKDLTWKANAIRVGVALKYSILPPKPENHERIEKTDTIRIEKQNIKEIQFVAGTPKIETEEFDSKNSKTIRETVYRRDTVYYPKTYNIDASITAVGLDSTGKEISNLKLAVEEFISSRLQPLLNYIFFDEASAKLDKKYAAINENETDSFIAKQNQALQPWERSDNDMELGHPEDEAHKIGR